MNLKRNFQRLLNWAGMKNMLSLNAIAKKDIVGDQSNILMQKSTESNIALPSEEKIEEPKFIEKISKLKLTSFIECCANNDYSSIVISGFPNSEELELAWIKLLSQFLKARAEENNEIRNEIVSKMRHLELRNKILFLVLKTLEMFYSKVLIEEIKGLDEEFSQFEFSEESYENDIQLIKNIEINNDIEYKELQKQLEELEALEKPKSEDEESKNQKAPDKEQVFYDIIMSYNEIFSTSYSVDNLNTMEYARMCYRRDRYIMDAETNKESSKSEQ